MLAYPEILRTYSLALTPQTLNTRSIHFVAEAGVIVQLCATSESPSPLRALCRSWDMPTMDVSMHDVVLLPACSSALGPG